MDWLEISLCATGKQTEQVIEALDTFEPLSISQLPLDDSEDIELYPGQTPNWERVQITALFSQDAELTPVIAGINQIFTDSGTPKLCISRVNDRDWHQAWQQRLQPIHIGEKLWICPTDSKPPQPDAVNLRLEPGLAFGTGSHPTTALCLESLTKADLQGKTVIDYGCGSGILAITALLLGAESAWGVDIDPTALTVSRENAVQNCVSERYQAVTSADLPDKILSDWLIANILSTTLQQLAPEIDKHVKPGGQLLLSGILQHQAEQVIERYQSNYRFSKFVKDEWVMLAGVKTASHAISS